MRGNVILIQGLYFFVTGVWPLVSIGTFQKVTGPKTDLWLVKTVGVIVAIIGAALALASLRGDRAPSIILLGMGSAVGLAAIDVIYVSKRVISPIYLLDALVELILMGWWLIDISSA